jgi:hypothetical protein
MAGRDAYLEMGFHEPVDPPNVQTSENVASVGRRTFESGQPLNAPTEPVSHFAFAGEPQKGEYAAGLIIVLLVLMIGFASGFFGRGFLSPMPPTSSDLVPLNATSLVSAETLPSGLNADLALFGSNHADELLALARMTDNDAMMLIKVHAGFGTDISETRLVKLTSTSDGTTFSPITAESVSIADLLPLLNGALISARLDNGSLTLERLNAQGEQIWSQNFATLASDPSQVSLASSDAGLVLLAPSENASFVRIASITEDGFVSWQSTLERPSDLTQTFVSVDLDGHILAVLGTGASAVTTFLGSDGRVLNTDVVALSGDDQISAAIPHAYGGISVLVSGSAPRLEQISPTGERYSTVPLPYMSYTENAHLIALDNGDMVATSTFALQSGAIEILLEQRSPDGVLVGERLIDLPSGSTLDQIIPAGDGEYLLSGSLRTDHYAPTDVFVRRIAFSPATHPIILAEAAPQSPSLIASEPVRPVEPEAAISAAPVEEASLEEDLPIIASLSVSPEPSVDAAALTVMDQPATEILEERLEPVEDASSETIDPVRAENIEAAPAELVLSETGTEPVEGASLIDIDLDGAAVSRFLGQAIVTQCRFTCLEPSTGSTFPATGHFLQSQLTQAGDIAAVHTQVCQAADLVPQLETAPNCGITTGSASGPLARTALSSTP